MNRKMMSCAFAACTLFPAGFAADLYNYRTAVLWTPPANIASRDLLLGQGGAAHAPKAAPFTFVSEDSDGKTPKFTVQDANGLKWKVKVGPEARPETVATRFMWAMGYHVDEDYFVPAMKVVNMPAKVKRGQEWVSNGVIHDARWERMDQKVAGTWKWSKNPFSGTRELNGLRVLLAMLNNWDVKRDQNTIYQRGNTDYYVVSDVGSTFGPTGPKWPVYTTRGDLERYRKSGFIQDVSNGEVDLAAPSWPMLGGVVPAPPLPYDWITKPFTYIGLRQASSPFEARNVGNDIPIRHALWMAGLLQQLTPAQIRQAFRAAHYSPEEVEGFSRVIETRIQELADLAQ